MRAPDKLVTPYVGETPDYSWHNKLATVYEAKRTGNLFLPLPHGYIPSPGEMERGGAFPHIRDYEPGTQAPGSILPTQESINEFREYNERDYQRSICGRVKNFKPRK